MSANTLKTILCGAASLVALVAGGAAAHAQDEEAAASEAERITVTGSRIARKDYTSNSPFVTISEQRIEISSSVAVDEVVNELPQVRGSLGKSSPFPVRGAQANINLRGLQPYRALVLLNGRRIQPSRANGSVDVNVIPPALVSRVETLTGGASAAYGSDAMSGVVNFLLKDDFSGVQLDLQYTAPTDFEAHGTMVSALLGGDIDSGRGNAVVSLSYSDRTSLRRGDRDFFAIHIPNARLPYAVVNLSSNPPTQEAVDALFESYGFPAGSVDNAVPLGMNIDGTFFSSPGNAPVINFKGYDSDDFFIFNNTVVNNSGQSYDIQQAFTRYNVFTNVDYQLTDSIEIYGQAFFTQYTSPSNGPPSSLGAAGSNGIVSADNPFIPDALRALLVTRDDPDASFPIQYLTSQIGDYVDEYRNSLYQVQLGLRGDAPVRDWTWDVYGSFGRTDVTNILFNNFHTPTINALLGAADGGASLCEGGFNPWAPPEEALSQECIDLIRRDPYIVSEFEQSVVEAVLEGGLMDLPAGEARFAAGVNYRLDSFSIQPDHGLTVPGEIPGFVTKPAAGSQDVYEGFVELLAPLLSDLPLVQQLDLNLGYRHSKYSTLGSTQTYKASGDWAVTDWVRVRGGYSRAIRAPSLEELFTPASPQGINIGQPSATGTTGDPCDVRTSYRLGPSGAQVRALCLAQGIPESAVDTYTYQGASVFGSALGNPNLQEEVADTYSVGVVVSSAVRHPLLEDAQLSVDYYDIQIADAIGTLPFQTGLTRCFNGDGVSNPTFDPNNINCTIINRDPATGRISEALIPTLNLAEYSTSGVDAQLDWRVDVADLTGGDGDLGRINVSAMLNYMDSFKLQTLPNTPILDYAGYTNNPLAPAANQFSLPKWKSVVSTSYDRDPFEIGFRWRYLSSLEDVTRLTSPTSNVQGVDPYHYFDLFARWDVNDRVRISAGIDNVADKEPPKIGTAPGVTDWLNYDVIGRTMFVRLSATLGQ